ncbi:MAG: tetratricopeptide repeat protein, partial [Thermoguttaceae bacterium]
RDVLPLAPFFVLGAASGLFTAWVERKLIGAEGAAFDLTYVDRFLIAGRVIWFYLGKLFWPVDLLFTYPRWEINQAVWWQYLFPAAVILLFAALWALHRRWRGPLAGMLFFAGTLFPALGFCNVYPFIFSFVADHFQYLASLGVIALVSAGIMFFIERSQYWHRIAVYALCLGMLAILAAMTWRQSGLYSDQITLYKATLDKNPDSWMSQYNLGLIHSKKNQMQEAIYHFKQALRIRPTYLEAYINLGNSFAALNQYGPAIEQYNKVLKIKPDYVDALYNLGNALSRIDQYQEAIRRYEQVLALKPDHYDAQYNLGVLLDKSGQTQEAIKHYEQALRFKPDDVDALNNLGLALKAEGQYQKAMEQYKKALEIKPDLPMVHNNLGSALLVAGRLQEAIEQFKLALQFKPDYVGACNNLALAYAAAHQSMEAIATAQKALELARYQGQTEMARQIEDWLRSYRDKSSEYPPQPPPGESVPP